MEAKKVYIPIAEYLDEGKELDNQTVKEILEDNLDKVSELEDCVFIPDERGTIMDDSLFIQDVEMDADGEGGVVVSFEWEAYYGCPDMNKMDDAEIDVSLKIDFKEKVLILESELPPEKRCCEPEEF